MKLDHKKIAAAIIGLTFVAGTAADAIAQTPRTRGTRGTSRPTNFNSRTVNRNTVSRNSNTTLNRNVNTNRNVNVNRNVNYNRNANWHGGGAWHNGYWHGGVWHAGYWGAAAAGAAIGAATAAAIGSTVYTLPTGCGTVVVGGVSYYQCGSAWYQPQYVGGSTQYIVVNPPQ